MKEFIVGNKKLATLDFETDPFLYGRTPEPFSCGLHTGDDYFEFWNNDPDALLNELIEFLQNYPEPLLIYAHNGGKFDFFYLLYKKVISNPVKIINSRITKAACFHHELRDSYSIIPLPLAAYQKDEIDYTTFERDIRENHKDDILHYLAKDCEYLYDLVKAFIQRFGLHLTIGALSLKTLRKFHPFDNINQTRDEALRPYYFGGRVQALETGVLKGNFKVIDVNSMYPAVMSNEMHPCGMDYTFYYDDAHEQISPKGYYKGDYSKPFFITFTGSNKGALPLRTKNGLYFNEEYGTFKVTSHELQVALKHKLIEIDEIHELAIPDKTINFKEFVDTFIEDKIQAKMEHDKVGEIFAKLVLNSSYGKTGQNPENFLDYYLYYEGDKLPDLSIWDLDIDCPFVSVFSKESPKPVYYDVGIAASVTGAARALLLDALCQVKRPIYCDTDSIICENENGLELDPYKLGAWDVEGEGDKLAVAGKKLYVLYNKGKAVKQASKGARLTPNDLLKIASGKQVLWKCDAPNFKINGSVKFTKRTIQKLA